MRQFIKRRLYGLSTAGLALLALSHVLAPWHYFPALLTHFTHFALPLLLIGAWLSDKRYLRYLYLMLGFGLLGWIILPISLPTQDKLPLNQPQSLIFYNAYIDNPKLKEDARTLSSQSTDMLAFVEVSQDNLAGVLSDYPYHCSSEPYGVFSMVLYARQPLLNCQQYLYETVPWLRVATADSVIYVLHPPPPTSAELADINRGYLQAVSAQIQQETGAVLVVGDFNLTPFSWRYHAFTRQSHLRTNMRHFTPTWRPFYLPIDRVFSNSALKGKVSVTALPWLHSDHRPLLLRWDGEITASATVSSSLDVYLSTPLHVTKSLSLCL